MPLEVNIQFEGNCRQAVEFYAGVFGLEAPYMLTYGQADTSFDENVQMAPGSGDLILSADLTIAGTTVHFNDMPTNFTFNAGNNFGLTLACATPAEAQGFFLALGDGGTVFVPLSEIPGQGHYGMLADRFGLIWTIRA